MKVYGKSDIGKVRSMNQDYMFYSTEPVGVLPNLFIVADGMGGHKAGDYASRLSVENFVDDAIHYVNDLVMDEAEKNQDYSGMGTTFVAAFIKDGTLFVGNIGDSRLYLIDEDITQVTEDHSYVGAMLRAGEITKEEALHHPDKNIITRAIGASRDPKVDFFEVDLEPGDRILLCTDGLTNMVDDDVILDIIANEYIGDVVDILIEEAKDNGGTDNVTAIVIEPFDEEVDRC